MPPPPPDYRTVRRYGYLVFGVICLSYVLAYFHRFCPAVLALDMQEAFGASGTLLGVLSSAYFYSYAVMQLPAGLLADSWGSRKTVSAFLLLAAAGSVLMALAPNLGIAVVGRVLVGAGVSTLFACNFKLLSEWFTPSEFVTMGGIFMAVGGLGALSASSPLAWLSSLVGWRASLVGVGFVTLGMAALVFAFVRNRPQEKGWPPIRADAPGSQGPRIALWQGMKEVLGSGRCWPISMWGFLVPGLSFALAGLWGGPYLIQVYGLSKQAAGTVLSMYSVGIIVGSPVLSALSNRVGRKPILLGCSILCLAISGLLWIAPAGLPISALYAVFFSLSFFGGAIGPVMAAVSKELFPPAIAGTAVGTVNLFPFFGAALFQVLMGAIVSRPGAGDPASAFAGVFLLSLCCAAAALVLALGLTETLPASRRTRAPAA